MTEFRYGDNRTIHRTGEVNIERDVSTGEVVSVWFRCIPLPFTDTVVDVRRAIEMRSMYEENDVPAIKAVVLHEGDYIFGNTEASQDETDSD